MPQKDRIIPGYHYLIDRDRFIDGKDVYEGRAPQPDGSLSQGAHTLCFNPNTIGICVLGNYEETGITDRQRKVLEHLCAWLCEKYGIDPQSIKGHKDYYGVRCNDCSTTTLGPPTYQNGTTKVKCSNCGYVGTSQRFITVDGKEVLDDQIYVINATACPGAKLHAQLPTIRANVANLLVCGNCEAVCQYTCMTICQPCETACESACQTPCETSCQTTCQLKCQYTCMITCQPCETACESACQTACQSSCQTSCELSCQPQFDTV